MAARETSSRVRADGCQRYARFAREGCVESARPSSKLKSVVGEEEDTKNGERKAEARARQRKSWEAEEETRLERVSLLDGAPPA